MPGMQQVMTAHGGTPKDIPLLAQEIDFLGEARYLPPTHFLRLEFRANGQIVYDAGQIQMTSGPRFLLSEAPWVMEVTRWLRDGGDASKYQMRFTAGSATGTAPVVGTGVDGVWKDVTTLYMYVQTAVHQFGTRKVKLEIRLKATSAVVYSQDVNFQFSQML